MLSLGTDTRRWYSPSSSPRSCHFSAIITRIKSHSGPKVHIIDSPALNAFATGRNPEHASIAVTTGLMQALENEELEGVIAHELSHVKNYDILVMTIVVVLVGTVSLIGNFFLRARLYGGRRSNDRQGGDISAIIMIVGILFL